MDVAEHATSARRWQLTYKLSDDDVESFRRFDMRYRRSRRKAARAFAVNFGIAFFPLYLLGGGPSIPARPLLNIAALSLAIATAVAMNSAITRRRASKRNRDRRPVTVEIGDDTVVQTTADFKIERRLQSLVDIVHDKTSTYLYITSTRALVLPNCAFKDPEEAAACHEYVLQRWKSPAQHQVVPTGASSFVVTYTLDNSALRHFTYSRIGRQRWFKGRNVVQVVLSRSDNSVFAEFPFGNYAIRLVVLQP